MCVIAVVGVAPCQCFLLGANQIKSLAHRKNYCWKVIAEGLGQRWVSVVVPVAVDDGLLAVLTWCSPDERIAISAPADNISNAPIAAVSGRTPLTQPQRTNLNDTRQEARPNITYPWWRSARSSVKECS